MRIEKWQRLKGDPILILQLPRRPVKEAADLRRPRQQEVNHLSKASGVVHPPARQDDARSHTKVREDETGRHKC